MKKLNFISTITPAYTQDDDSCTFVGTVKIHKKHFGANVVDIYTCGSETICRFGNDDAEYVALCADQLAFDCERSELVRKAISEKPEWNADLIRERLERSDKWVAEAIVAIYNYQTIEEQAEGITVEDNGVGFNGVDAEILTSYAEFYKKAGFLTPKQLVIGRNKIKKYAGQLAKIAQRKAEPKTIGDIIKQQERAA